MLFSAIEPRELRNEGYICNILHTNNPKQPVYLKPGWWVSYAVILPPWRITKISNREYKKTCLFKNVILLTFNLLLKPSLGGTPCWNLSNRFPLYITNHNMCLITIKMIMISYGNFNAVLIRLVAQVKISLLLKIQWRKC